MLGMVRQGAHAQPHNIILLELWCRIGFPNTGRPSYSRQPPPLARRGGCRDSVGVRRGGACEAYVLLQFVQLGGLVLPVLRANAAHALAPVALQVLAAGALQNGSIPPYDVLVAQ